MKLTPQKTILTCQKDNVTLKNIAARSIEHRGLKSEEKMQFRERTLFASNAKINVFWKKIWMKRPCTPSPNVNLDFFDEQSKLAINSINMTFQLLILMKI